MRKLFVFSISTFLVASGPGRADDPLVPQLIAQFNNPKNAAEVRSTAIRALGALGWPGKEAHASSAPRA